LAVLPSLNSDPPYTELSAPVLLRGVRVDSQLTGFGRLFSPHHHKVLLWLLLLELALARWLIARLLGSRADLLEVLIPALLLLLVVASSSFTQQKRVGSSRAGHEGA
jgi:hypothetical protein